MLTPDQVKELRAFAEDNYRGWGLPDLVAQLQYKEDLIERCMPYQEEEEQLYRCQADVILRELKRRRELPAPTRGPDQDVKEAIKLRANLPDIAERYVQVFYHNHRWTFRCTRHGNDRTPSGVIYPDQHWYCFGCGKGGDVFDFIQLYGHRSFTESLHDLSRWLGIDPQLSRGKRKGGLDL